MSLDISRSTIAARYKTERRINDRTSHFLNYSNAEIRDKVLSDLFADWAWPGGYPVAYYISERDQLTGDVLCADCAREEVIENRGVVCADIHYEGPSEWCTGCQREIESAYGDPDEVTEEEEDEDGMTDKREEEAEAIAYFGRDSYHN